MKKTTFTLIILGIVIVFGVGIVIGTTLNNSQRMNNVDNNKSNNNSITIDKDIKDTTNNIENEKEEIKENNEVKTIEYSTKDNDVITSLNNTLNTVKESKVTEDFTKSAKKTFIDIVDFLFYGGTIKGVTFEELTDNGKSKVLEIASKIDEAIEKKIPNYKETISDGTKKAFKEASNLIKKGSSSLNNFLKEKLSEESYNAIINGKDDLVYYTKNAVSFIKDNGSKLFNTLKDKLSSWYERYKNN